MARKRPKGRPEPLGNVLRGSFAGTTLGERLKDLAIWQHWEQVVGAAIARRARPVRLAGGVLTVAVGSAPWMQQLSFMKADLITRLNGCLGEERVQEIVLKSARVVDEVVPDEVTPPVARPLSQEDQTWIDQQVREVADDDLQCQLRTLIESHYRFGKTD